MSLEEKFETLLKNYEAMRLQNEEIKGQNEYLKKQLGESLKQKRKEVRSSRSSNPSGSDQDGVDYGEYNHLNSSSDEEPIRRPRRNVRNLPSFGDIKVEVPEFEGKLDPDEFLEWLQTVERIFDYKEIPDEKKVKLVALRLRKYASLWWSNVCAKRARQGKGKIRTWEKMKTKLRGRFLPPSYLQDNYAQLHSLAQGNMSVEEYTREFEKLLIKCDLREAEEQTIVRYLGGLDPRYAHVVELQQYTTFDEVCILAHKVEQQRKAKLYKRDPPKPFPRSQPFNKGSPYPPPKPTVSNPPPPQKNQAPQKSQIPPNRPTPSPMSNRRCFKCQGLGHIASECPNRRIISLAEWDTSREEEEEEEKELYLMEEQEEVVEEADEGELLVLRRALSSQKGALEEQRENIFHTRCTM